MKVAFQSVVWGQRIDNLDYMLQVLQACGYQGLEIAQSPQNIFVMGKNGPEPVGTINDLIARCQKYGLTLIGLVGGTLEERVEYIGIRRDLFLYLDNWPEDAWQLLVQPNPIRLAIHPHWLMPIRKRSHFEALFESVYARIVAYYDKKGHSAQQSKTKAETACQNLRLIVDTAHSVIAEDDPVAFVSDWLSSLEVVHLKGWKPDFGKWSHRYPKGFCIPDKGIVPVDAVMDRLTELKYSGWLVMEQEHFEQSRMDTALKCAEWVEKNASRWPLRIKVDYAKVADLASSPPSNPWRETVGTLSSIEMARAFAANPTTNAESFYGTTVATLRNLLKPEYVKLWSYNPSTRKFYLLDAMDRNGQTIKCLTELPEVNTLAASVAASSTVLFYDLDDADTRRHFNDAEFLGRVESRWMICVPIFNAANAHHLRGMFSLFTDAEYNDQQKRLLELLSHIIAIWSDFVGGEVCAAAAGATNYMCGVTKGGVGPFIDKLRLHILEMFDCENVLIFLRDASRTRLYPIGACASKIRWKEGLPLAKQFYEKGEGLTGRVWNENEMLFSDAAPETGGYVGKSREFNPGGEKPDIVRATGTDQWRGSGCYPPFQQKATTQLIGINHVYG